MTISIAKRRGLTGIPLLLLFGLYGCGGSDGKIANNIEGSRIVVSEEVGRTLLEDSPFSAETETTEETTDQVSLEPTVVSAIPMIIFGDSLSDTGNVVAYLSQTDITVPGTMISLDVNAESITNGAVTNGMVPIQFLGEYLSATTSPSLTEGGTNYAVGGATILGESTLSDTEENKVLLLEDLSLGPEYVSLLAPGVSIPSRLGLNLATQIDLFLEDVQLPLAEDVLLVVSIGGNDVAAATDLCIELQDAVDCPNDVVVPLAVDRLEQEVRRLLDETSATVLLTNVPNIALTPRFDEPGKVQQADALTNRFTGLLAGRVEQLLQEYENRIIYFDLYQNHTQLLENTTEGEFANVTDACGDLALGYDKNYDGEIDTDDLDLETLLFVTTELNIVTNYTFEGDCTADTINQYFYYDSFHGTEAAYRLLGNGLIDAVCPRDGLRMTPAMIHGICPE